MFAIIKSMRICSRSVIKASAAQAVVLAFFFAAAAHSQRPGSYLWGDADGNGVIEVPDLIALNAVLANPGAGDALVYRGHPQSRFRSEVSGDGILDGSDLILINRWLGGDFSSRPGNPDRLLLDGATLDVQTGDSVELSAYALSPASSGGALRTGFGVVFKISGQSQCSSAELLGYDPVRGSTVAWRGHAAFNYTAGPQAPEDGRARVRLRPAGCALGQKILVDVYIPDDAKSRVAPGRFPDRLAAAKTIEVTVACNDRDGDGHGVNCPDGPDCNDSDSTIYAGAMEIYGDRIDQDCDGRDPDDFYINPHLQLGNQFGSPQISDRVTVAWANSRSTIGQLLYGTTFPPGARVSEFNPAQSHELDLTGLLPDTKYYYQVIAGNSLGPVSAFTTAPVDLHKPVRFAYIGDTRTNHDVHLAAIDMIRGWKPSFLLHGGDMVEAAWDVSQWLTFFSIEQRVIAFAPLAPVIGNHDFGAYETAVSVPLNLNADEHYYSWDYGNIHFVHTATEYVGPEQDAALATDLAAAAAHYPKPRFIIALMHRNAYSNSGHPGDENYAYSTIWGPNFEQSKTAIVIQAHVHSYERFEPIDRRAGLGIPTGNPQIIRKGVTYMTVGSGGAPLYAVMPPPGIGGYGTPPLDSLVSESNYQAMLIDVSGGTMHVRVIRPDNTLMDEFYVIRNFKPSADAGHDFSATVNSPVSLDGSDSYDPEDDPLSFQWVQTAGTPVILNDASTARPEFTPAFQGDYTFQLTVNDSIDSAAGSVTVTITP